MENSKRPEHVVVTPSIRGILRVFAWIFILLVGVPLVMAILANYFRL